MDSRSRSLLRLLLGTARPPLDEQFGSLEEGPSTRVQKVHVGETTWDVFWGAKFWARVVALQSSPEIPVYRMYNPYIHYNPSCNHL